MNIFEVEVNSMDSKPNHRPYKLGDGDLAKLKKKLANKKANKEAQDLVYELKCIIGCEDCGWNEIPGSLAFHHVVRSPDNRKLSACNSIRKVVRELPKGQFLCPNCHHKRHHDPKTGKVHFNKDEFR